MTTRVSNTTRVVPLAVGILVALALAPGASHAELFGIAGRATTDAGPLCGVTVTLTPGALVTTTDDNGDYSFTGLVAGEYAVRPLKGGYRFRDTSYIHDQRTVVLGPSQAGLDFLADRLPITEDFTSADGWVDYRPPLMSIAGGYLKLRNQVAHAPFCYRKRVSVLNEVDIELRVKSENSDWGPDYGHPGGHIELGISRADPNEASIADELGPLKNGPVPQDGLYIQMTFREGDPEPSWCVKQLDNGVETRVEWLGHGIWDLDWHVVYIQIREGSVSIRVDSEELGQVPAALPQGLERRLWLGATSGNATIDYVRVTKVPPGNRAPVAGDDSYETAEDCALTVPRPGVLLNDTDADGDAVTASKVSDPSHGTVTLNLDGSFTYVPETDWHGEDTFRYMAGDGIGDSNEATVTITVDPQPDPPVARAGDDQTVEANAIGGAEVSLDGSASSDADGDPLTYHWSWIAAGGAEQHAEGVRPSVFLPLGRTVVSLVVNDGTADSEADTVEVTVVDTTPPTITAPDDVTARQSSDAGTPVAIGQATAVDIQDPSPVVTNDAPALFPLGETVVTWCATDDSGNRATATQTVTVVYTTPTVLVACDAAGTVGTTVQLSAQLSSGGMPLAGQPIDFTIGAWTGSALTDATGTARVLYTIAQAAGTYPIQAAFAGTAVYRVAYDSATLTVGVPAPTAITIVENPAVLTAGQSQTYHVIGNNDNGDITAQCTLWVSLAAGGSWSGNVYTSEKAGTWTVSALYNTLSDTAALTVNHGAAAALQLTPASAQIPAGATQAYTVIASDAYGNSWPATLPAGDWTVAVAGGGAQSGTFDAANTYQSVAADANKTLHITCTVGAVTSNPATLGLTGNEGCTLAWDKDTGMFYLCADAADPQTGIPVPASGTYTVGGCNVVVALTGGTRDITAAVTNCVTTNSLRMRWYMNGGSLYRVYQTSTIAGVSRTLNWTTPAAFVGVNHTVGGYDAATATWSTVAYGTTTQP